MLNLAQGTMKAKDKKTKAAQKFSSELGEPRWSVISFERREAGNLTYAQARQKLNELEAGDVAGLCIVSDEAAERMSRKQ